MSAIRRLLLPDPPRDFRSRRAWKIVLRALHIAAVSMMVGGYAFATDESQVLPWLWATIGTGAAILALDLHESAAFLFQIRGAVLLLKLASLPLLHLFPAWRVPLLLGVVIVSTISSHAPSRVRYFLWYGRGRIQPGTKKG